MTHRPDDSGVPGREAGDAPREEDLQIPDSDEGAAGGGLYDPQLELDLGAELELARGEAAKHLELAQRIQAEFDNYRKRVARDAEDALKRAGQRIVEELLPVLDNLERAIEHTREGGDVSQLLAGVEMVHQQMLDVLGKEGVSSQDPLGQRFDPSLHQAVGQREDVEIPDHTVVDVYQKGYEMSGRVIRPAMVVVSTGGPAGSEE